MQAMNANDELRAHGGLNDDFEPLELEETGLGESIAAVWSSVGAKSALDGECWGTEAPKPREYLLSTQAQTSGWEAKDAQGVLPLGKVGMLAAAGGSGKSWLLMQMAVSVATGRSWLGTYEVSTPGYVLMAMGEEERLEARRRFYYAVQHLQLTPEEMELAKERVYILPLCGKPVCLTQDQQVEGKGGDFGESMETVFAGVIRQRLENAGHPWSLVVFDPMSRFAGPDVEIDNAAATRFVQALERYTEVPGNPTVLAAHHTSKASRNGDTNAAAARGSSALTDGVRWQANLDPMPANSEAEDGIQLVQFKVTKSNYSLFPPPLLLVRDAHAHGALRPANASELEQYCGGQEEAVVQKAVKRKEISAKVKERFSEKHPVKNDDSEAPSNRPHLNHQDQEDQL